MDWDDLRFFLAVARAGSLSAAARTLGVNHSTVSRRINALEEQLQVRLFERGVGGFATTAAGEAMRESASRMEEEWAALDRQLVGRDARLSGTLRVATAEVSAALLSPDLAAFRERYPDVELEVIADFAFANLTRREADVALRATNSPPEHLIGRRVCDIATAIYASKSYLDACGERELADHSWVGWEGESMSSRWLRTHLPGAAVQVRVDCAAYLLEAVKGGMGVAHMVCFRGDVEPELRRIHPPIDEMCIGFWLLTHPDLRRTARVRTFLDFMAGRVARHRDLIEGRSGGG